jgi:hypothetical protein
MLKDIRDSWKLANFAAASLPFPMSPRIISFVYWPEIPATASNNSFKIFPLFQNAFSAYEKVYNQHRAARNISWHLDFGTLVELELEVHGKVIEIEAPLAQAEIIILFTEKGTFFYFLKNAYHILT